MHNELFSSQVLDRLSYALGKIEISSDYRERMLSLVSRSLHAQFHHHETRTPYILLPSFCCCACGEPPERSIGVSIAWFLLQISASLLDKVEDHELLSELLVPCDVSIVANLTTGMIFVAQWILGHLELDHVDAGTAWDIQQAFHETILTVCSGQHLDLMASTPDLSTCWHIAEAKSGAAFALACYAGARLATSRSEMLDAFVRFGRDLGTIIQINDDLEDVAGISTLENPYRINKTLIGAYMQFANGLATNVGERQLAACEQSWSSQELVRSGSILYLQLEKLKYATMAENALSRLKLADDYCRDLISVVHQESRIGMIVQ